MRAGLDDDEQVLSALRALALAPDSPAVLNNPAAALAERGNPEEARNLLLPLLQRRRFHHFSQENSGFVRFYIACSVRPAVRAGVQPQVLRPETLARAALSWSGCILFIDNVKYN